MFRKSMTDKIEALSAAGVTFPPVPVKVTLEAYEEKLQELLSQNDLANARSTAPRWGWDAAAQCYATVWEQYAESGPLALTYRRRVVFHPNEPTLGEFERLYKERADFYRDAYAVCGVVLGVAERTVVPGSTTHTGTP